MKWPRALGVCNSIDLLLGSNQLTSQAGAAGRDASVIHPPLSLVTLPAVCCTARSCIVSTSTRSLLESCGSTSWRRKCKSHWCTFISFCATISRGLASQVSSWTEVHRCMLEEVNREGKEGQSPRLHFLLDKLFGLLVLWELLFCAHPPILTRTCTYLSSETWLNSIPYLS